MVAFDVVLLYIWPWVQIPSLTHFYFGFGFFKTKPYILRRFKEIFFSPICED